MRRYVEGVNNLHFLNREVKITLALYILGLMFKETGSRLGEDKLN